MFGITLIKTSKLNEVLEKCATLTVQNQRTAKDYIRYKLLFMVEEGKKDEIARKFNSIRKNHLSNKDKLNACYKLIDSYLLG